MKNLTKVDLERIAAHQDSIYRMIREAEALKRREQAKSDLFTIAGVSAVILFIVILANVIELPPPPMYIEETPCLSYSTESTMVPSSFTGGINPSGWTTVEEEVCTSYGETKLRTNPDYTAWLENQKSKASK